MFLLIILILSAQGSSYLPSVERSALPLRFERSGPPQKLVAFWGERRVLSPNNASVILCDLHTEREAQVVIVVFYKK